MTVYFLQFSKPDGQGKEVRGHSTDVKHPGWIELEAFSWGVTQSAGTGQTSGKEPSPAKLQDFHLVTADGAAFSGIMFGCVNGTRFPTVTLEAGKEELIYLRVVLTDVFISSCYTGGDRQGLPPTLQFSLNAVKVQWNYFDASAGTPLPKAAAPPPRPPKTK